jgi:hypothetical protein
MALDADYRKIGLSIAPAGFKEVAMFCDRRCGNLFRFAPLTRRQVIDYTPLSPDAPQEPPPELVTALRFASALMPALTRTPGTDQLKVYARWPADMRPYVDGEIAGSPGDPCVPIPEELKWVFHHLVKNHGGFSLDVRRGGLEADLHVSERAYHVDLWLAKAVTRSSVGQCFKVNGSDADCDNPEALLEAIQSLEQVVPKRGREEIVLVIDDTHGMWLDVGIQVMSAPTEDVLGGLSLGRFRKGTVASLEDLVDQWGLEDAERIDVDESAVGSALDRIQALADSEFKLNGCYGEFESRVAAIRGGKLIAFYGDNWEVENKFARASLRVE